MLVVDDEPQILRALQTKLRGAGYEVDDGRDGRGGADAAAAMRPPEAVILDLVLPDGSGTDVCRELRALELGARSSSSPPSATRRRRSQRSTRAPTTTCTKPFGDRRAARPAARRCCAGRRPPASP